MFLCFLVAIFITFVCVVVIVLAGASGFNHVKVADRL
jgi:hypothetical protein